MCCNTMTMVGEQDPYVVVKLMGDPRLQHLCKPPPPWQTKIQAGGPLS